MTGSAAISLKMSALLYLPGLLVILFKKRGLVSAISHFVAIVLFQVWRAREFLETDAGSYFRGAFDFSRVFLYKWTVNWRIIDEQTFLDPRFAKILLLAHLLTLISFGWNKWCRLDGGVISVLKRGIQRPMQPAALVPVLSNREFTNRDMASKSNYCDSEVVTVLYTTNLIGILFARSLHYQFYSWYAQQLPFLAWQTTYPTPIKYVFQHSCDAMLTLHVARVLLLFGIEYAWNVFPSTVFSSTVLNVANALIITGIYFGYAEGRPSRFKQ
jgi:alpha-1,3-mannosyltransferase